MEPQKPIGGGLAVTLIAFAVFIDVLQAILTFLLIGIVLNPAIDILASLVFSMLLASHGGGLFKRRAISMIFTAIGEFIPVVNALPLWTAFAFYTVFMDRARTTIKKHSSTEQMPRGGGGWRL